MYLVLQPYWLIQEQIICTFSGPLVPNSKVQARLHLLMEVLLRATQIGIQHICLLTIDKACHSLLNGKQAINWRCCPRLEDSIQLALRLSTIAVKNWKSPRHYEASRMASHAMKNKCSFTWP